MKKISFMITICVMMLVACGRPVTDLPAEEVPMAESAPDAMANGDRSPSPEVVGRPEKQLLKFFSEGKTEQVSAALHIGEGYSIYVPERSWRMDRDLDGGVLQETWEHTVNDDIQLSVYHYNGVSREEARAAFAARSEYRFHALSGNQEGTVSEGVDEDGDVMEFLSTEGKDAVYIVSWEYPAAANESFGALLRQMADTFQVT